MAIDYSITPRGEKMIDEWNHIIEDDGVPLEAKFIVANVINEFIKHQIESGQMKKSDLSDHGMREIYPEEYAKAQKPPEPPERKKSRFELIDMG
jgi:hypothetical protein